MTTATEHWPGARPDPMLRQMPEIVCLCGSTRFYDVFDRKGLELTLAGKIILSIGTCAPDSRTLAHPMSPKGREQKRNLDELHKRKIDLADRVLVLNVGGYIGMSTKSEIVYAHAIGRPVHYLEPIE
jgi:hypothetical protein